MTIKHVDYLFNEYKRVLGDTIPYNHISSGLSIINPGKQIVSLKIESKNLSKKEG